MSDDNEEDFETDDDFEDDDEGNDVDEVDEVGGDGNRIVGARARDSVELIARNLVDAPDGVFVDANERGESVTLLVHASPGDLGRLIGKRGRVIQALRQLVRAAGTADGVKANVDIVE